MNPQANNNFPPSVPNPPSMPPARPSSPLSVPSRPAPQVNEIDDSAFAVDTPRPVYAPQPAPVAPIQPVAPAAPQATRPVQPALPAPLPIARPAVVTPQPTAPVVLPPAPIQPPARPAVVQPAPAPPIAPTPLPPAPIAAPPVQVMPPSSPPAIPQPVIAPAAPQPIAPAPVAPLPPQAPTPVTAAPVSAVAFQPDSGPHVATSLIERIDETPQQNSRDIEALINHNHLLKRLKSVASFFVFVAGVVIAAFLINQFIFQSYYVDGTSMTPTLQNDDRLIIDKVEHTLANVQGKTYVPERGQIIVLDSSLVGFNGREEQLIKRVIGLPGDTVRIKDGIVSVTNSQYPQGIDTAKDLKLDLKPTFVDSPQEWKIEEGHVFVMGDNRVEGGSLDSRSFGPIEASKIVGRLWARILPVDKAQIF